MNNIDVVVEELIKLLSVELNECSSCGHIASEYDEENAVIFGSDPFASEINGDHTEYWICEKCRYESAMEI